MATEAELMRTCAPLYGTFALEALWTIILATFFGYLSILISSKQQLKNPVSAVCNFICFHFGDWVADTYRVLSRWDQMHLCDLGQRFRFTRRLNATICRIQVVTAILSLTRWLHINNVNGFRYLSYSFTCPLMQAELVLLIAPAVPCYRLNVCVIMLVTWTVMIAGWYASSLEGDLFQEGYDWQEVLLEGSWDKLTSKGKAVMPSMVGVLTCSMVQMPYLFILYNFCGKREDMPDGMNSMILLTAVSWLGFPIWWFLSFEGASIISDTKLNGAGFLILNIISKGGFTLKMISMVKEFKRKQKDQQRMMQGRERSGSVASLYSLPELPADPLDPQPPKQQQQQTGRVDKRQPTGQSLVWMIQAMKPFDQDDGRNEFHNPEVYANQKPEEQEKVQHASQLTNEELATELMRRMDMDSMSRNKLSSGDMSAIFGGMQARGMSGGGGFESEGTKFETDLNMQILNACNKFVIEEDSDEE